MMKPFVIYNGHYPTLWKQESKYLRGNSVIISLSFYLIIIKQITKEKKCNSFQFFTCFHLISLFCSI